MEYIEGMTLEQYIKERPFTEDQWYELGISLAEALMYLHERANPLIYRDLKPSNIMIASPIDSPTDSYAQSPTPTYRLIDLGVACECGTRKNKAGSPHFAAPEQLLDTTSPVTLTYKADLYAAARLMLWTLAKAKEPILIPDELMKYLNQCCDENPASRPGDLRLFRDAMLEYKYTSTQPSRPLRRSHTFTHDLILGKSRIISQNIKLGEKFQKTLAF